MTMSSRSANHGHSFPRRSVLTRVAGTAQLIHPFPVAVVVLTSGVLLELAHHGGLGISVLARACAAVLFSQIAVGALNDYIDRFSDALVQPDKPIPSGVADPRTALILVAVGLAGLVPLALSFGPISLLLLGAGTAAGLAYDLRLKRTPLSVTGYIVGFLLLVTWIWWVAGTLSPGFLILYPVGALLVTAAHLAQSLPDIETDWEVGAHGLAVSLGVRGSTAVILICYLALALGTAGITVRAGIPIFALGPLIGLVLVSAAAQRLRVSGYTRPARVVAFKVFAPALALIAIAAAVSCVRLGVL
jgi:4-hydroxybenzoate polyprenyltransferase